MRSFHHLNPCVPSVSSLLRLLTDWKSLDKGCRNGIRGRKQEERGWRVEKEKDEKVREVDFVKKPAGSKQ